MLRTLKNLKNIKGKRVLVRVDFNVPLKAGGVADDSRIRETLPTLKFLLSKKAKVIIISHLGRPEGKVVEKLKIDAVAKQLKKLIGVKVYKLNACVGPKVQAAIKKMREAEIVVLENIRFYPEEEKNDPTFAKKLAALGDFFVNDAFATCHRRHASTVGVAKLLPSYAGFLVEREIKGLTPLLAKKIHKLTLIVGGAKVDTKMGILKNFFGRAEHILIGGGLANTFLSAEGYDIGASFYEPGKIETARELMMLAERKNQKIVVPEDVIVADEATEHARTVDLPLEDVEGSMKILDIGAKTQKKFIDIINASTTVIWNGPMGLYEFTPFMSGTKVLATALSKSKKVKTYLGGGDTVDAISRAGISLKKFTFVSTGGGAMLEFLEGKSLPGIKVLKT